MEDAYDVIGLPLLTLNKLGIFTKTKSRKIAILSAIYVLLMTYLEFAALLQLWYLNGDVAAFTIDFEAIAGFAQVITKLVLIIYRRSALIKISEQTKAFWKLNKCPEKTQLKLQKNLKRILQFQRSFIFCTFLSVIVANSTILLGKSLPFGTWKMDKSGFFYYSVLTSQCIILLVVAPIIGAFDCLFLGFCMESVIQFRILCYCLEHIKIAKDSSVIFPKYYEKQLTLCIQYHIILIRFLEDLQHLYSSLLLCQYTTSSAVICSNMYAVFENNDIKHVLSVVTQVLQLVFYCIPADYVTHEALTVSGAIYSSEWYLQSSSSLKNMVVLATQKSQIEFNFRAGGFIDINSRALITVLKASWSICTLMRRLQ